MTSNRFSDCIDIGGVLRCYRYWQAVGGALNEAHADAVARVAELTRLVVDEEAWGRVLFTLRANYPHYDHSHHDMVLRGIIDALGYTARVVDDALAESKPHAKSPTPAVELNESGVDFDACAHCGHDDRAHWVGADDNGTGGVCGVIRCGCSLFADGPPRHPGPLRNPKQVAWFEYVIKR